MRNTAHLTPERLKELYEALMTSANAVEAAKRVGVNPKTAQLHARRLRAKGIKPFIGAPLPPQTTQAQEPVERTRAEIHDASFWRAKARRLERELAQAEHLIEQLGGIREVPVDPPRWLADVSHGTKGRSVIGALVSDVHYGEVIDPEEINGVNAFNPEICERRMKRYFEAVCGVGQRWASDTQCEGLLLALAGDLISGDIHEELRITNALTAHEQVSGVVGLLEAGIRQARKVYPRVHVVAVPGNHGRSTVKPTAKLYARLSYDIMVASILADRLRDDDNVTFQFGKAKDQITPVFGRTVLTTHFDKIGTRGGMGFAGPMLPIVRGTKKISEQQASVGRRPDLIQGGHYHTTGNPGNVLANGSVPGYSEFADDLRASFEPPQQWLYLLHSKWWLRERAPIQLEPPGSPEKIRVKAPTTMTEL